MRISWSLIWEFTNERNAGAPLAPGEAGRNAE
jgi:hypothetical protein